MRIVIVGTSNSLRKDGYTAYLRADKRVTELCNLSIGASTGLHSIRSTAGVDFAGYDFCIVDLSVNEEVVNKNGALNLDVSRGIVDSLIVRCLTGGCIPIIALLPRMMESTKAQMRTFYLQVASDWGLPYFDGYDLVDGIQAVSDVEKSAIFGDAAHIRPWVCLVFARALVDGLASLPADRIVDRQVFAPAFGIVSVVDHLTDWAGLERVERGNARASGIFARATGPSVIGLAGVDAKEAVGMCVNLSETFCVAQVAGDGTSALDLRSLYFGHPAFKLIISALPLMKTVGAREGHLEIQSLDAAGAAALVSYSEASGELGRVTAPATGQIEISDLFIRRRGEIISPHAPADGLHRALLLPSACDAIEVAAGVYRSLISKEHDHAADVAARRKARAKRLRKERAKEAAEAAAREKMQAKRLRRIERIRNETAVR